MTPDPSDTMWALEVLVDSEVPSANARKISQMHQVFPHEIVVIAAEDEIAELVGLLREALEAREKR